MTFRWSASDPSASDIGQYYDFGLATRDGAALTVLDKNLKPVQASQMAYMLSRDPQHSMDESTELQEKEKLIQLGTSTSIDREFDQWVQNTQGDWSGGIGQRVYGSQSIVNQYFDGEGLLWPLNDYVPQKPLPGPTLGLPPGFTAFALNDICGGYLNGVGQGYAYVDLEGGNFVCHFQSGDSDHNVVVGTAVGGFGLLAITVAAGFIWLIENAYPTTTTMRIHQVGMVNGVLSAIHTDALGPAANYGAGAASAIVSASYVSNKLYVAVAIQSTDSATQVTWQNELFLLDYTVPGVPTGLATPFDFPKSATQVSGSAFRFVDLAWQGASLSISVSDGFSSSILQLAAPFTTVTTQAILSGLPNAFMCAVGSQLLLVATSVGANNQVNRMEIFILNGGQLTEWGVINTPTPLLDSVTSPVSFGGYAIWAVSYTLPGAATKTVTVFAFDVIRTRLFRALTFTAAGWTGNDGFTHNEVAVFGATSRTLQPGATFAAQWGIALFSGLISNSVETAREFYWGVLPLTPPPTFNGLLRMGVDIVSGLFDFTASTNKLFRQKLSHFIDGLVVGASSPSLTLKSWFDQDPDRLAPVPDFTAGTGTPSTLSTQPTLDLFENRVAVKTVYEAISAGGGLASRAAGAIAYASLGTVAFAYQVVLTAGAAVGDLVVVCGVSGPNQFDGTSSVTDSKGNVWKTDAFVWNAAATGGGAIAHSVLTTALLPGDTITFTFTLANVATGNLAGGVSVVQVTGLTNPTATAAVEQTSSAIGNSNTPATGPVALSLEPEVVIAAIGALLSPAVLAPSAGWTAIGDVTDGAFFDLQPLYQTFAAPGASTPGGVYAGAHQWGALQVAFTNTTWVNAPKLVDVIIAAATGWVWDLVVDLSPNAKRNSGDPQEGAYSAQSDPTTNYTLDQVAAYNFLRALWRQKGGKCTIYLPNGDSFPALIQLEKFSAPKPFAVSSRSDQQSQYQELVTLKIREDI